MKDSRRGGGQRKEAERARKRRGEARRLGTSQTASRREVALRERGKLVGSTWAIWVREVTMSKRAFSISHDNEGGDDEGDEDEVNRVSRLTSASAGVE